MKGQISDVPRSVSDDPGHLRPKSLEDFNIRIRGGTAKQDTTCPDGF